MKKFNIMIITTAMIMTGTIFIEAMDTLTHFRPATAFNNAGFTGNYSKTNKTATINDASGKIVHSFKNLKEGGIVAPKGLTLIGTYTQGTSKGMISSHAIVQKSLYGQLNTEESNNVSTADESITDNTMEQTFDQRQPMGSNAATYAPQTMSTLSEDFNGQGLVGLYFASSKTVTIHDPSQVNTTSYIFNNVVEETSAQAPEGLVFIGTLVSPVSSALSFAMPITNLYGQLQE